jgi:hypothetical protein
MLKIAFESPHCLADFTSGAATATRDELIWTHEPPVSAS